MSPFKHRAILTLASIALAPGSAHADTVNAGFTYDHAVGVRITAGPVTGDVHTVSFHWTRTDAPAAGVDSTVPNQFPTFCVEVDQVIRSGNQYLFNVRTMQEVGYSETTQSGLQSLWAAHINELTTDTTSAAFQLAVWELRYDSDRNLDTGTFRVSSPSSAVSLAQSWLSALSSTTTTLRDPPILRVLVNDDSQDQLTEIPEPGAIACMLAGIALLRRRRTR